MNRRRFNLVFSDPRESKGARTLCVPVALIVVFAIALLVGLAGFGRIVYIGSGYALAVNNAAEQQRENGRLKTKIESLDRFVKQEVEIISRLVTYEDNARLKYGMEAISSDVRKAGVGGLPSRDDILYSSMADPLIVKAEALRLQVSALSNQAELQESTFEQISEGVQKLHSYFTKRPSIWPANGRLTSGFGYRFHPILGMRLMHQGIDIANEIWTPIYAAGDGIVSEASDWTHFGNMVKISHNNGKYITLYAHMQKFVVSQGQAVMRGQVIGYIGLTGRTTGPHLHYEVHDQNGHPLDPMQFIVAVDQIVD
ncbi:MAG: M23 family metallopeptidase [Chitinispirillia bacterium]|nr:M23 family metallopeptidase [Chitinispirillia bacterium]MCL2268352.1 M23 family metallopeptidase [Chitinispirillia bacterium]